MSAFDEMVSELTSRGFRRELAEAEVRRQRPELAPESIEKAALDEEALEKEHETEGDRVMLALGFDVIRFSHPGKTKQTPGIADRRYYRRPRKVEVRDWRGVFDHYAVAPAITLWWEAKSETGRQRPDQVEFQELVEACGETYVLGTHKDLMAWLEANRIVQVEQDGSITPIQE